MHKSGGLIFFLMYFFIIIYDFIFNFYLKSLKTHWSNFYNGLNRQRITGSSDAVPVYFWRGFGQDKIKSFFYVDFLNDQKVALL